MTDNVRMAEENAQQTDSGTAAQQHSAQESQATTAVPDEAENVEQYTNFVGKGIDTDKIDKK